MGNFHLLLLIGNARNVKELMCTYVGGVIYDNEALDKSLEIRKLAPSKEKRISPDGNCLLSSLSYVIAGSDHYHNNNNTCIKQRFHAYMFKCAV